MAGKAKKYLLISALVPLVLLCAIGFGLIPVNLSFAKSFLNEFVAEQLGMDLQIQGPLRIRLGPAPALTASKIALKYPPADGPALAQIEQLAISLRLMALLDGDIFLRKINISDIEIDYCLRGSPKATVDTKASNELGTLSSIAIDELKIRNIRASCSEQENRLGLLPQDLDLEAFAPLNGPMQVSVTGHSEELETHLQFSTGSLVDLLNDPSDFPFELNLQIPDSDLSISGQLTTPFSSPEISVEGVLVSDRMEQATGSRRLSFNGTARDFFTHPYFEIEATLQQVDFQRMALSISGQFDSDEPVDLSLLEPPLEDYHFSSDVVIGENELLFNGLNARIGTSQALGDIGIRYREPDYLFDIDINSPFLETDDLVHWVAEWRKENRAPSPESQSAPAGEAAEGGILALVDKSIDDFTGSNEFDISISIDELQSSGQSLGQALLELKTEGEDIHLNPLQVISPAGKAIAHYHGVDKGAEYEYALDVLVEGLQYGGLLRLFDPDAQASGELFLETSLVSRSPDASSALGHINGTFDLAVFPRDARAEFLDLWASNLIFALLPATGGSDKVMNCMVSRFEMEKGVMHSANTFLDSTEVIVRARGDIDLGKQQLDLLIAPQAKREKFLSVSTPIAVTGPFADFQVGVAPGGFLTSMFRLYYGLIYVPWKWLTGERFAADGIATCHKAMGWEMPDNPK